MECLSDLYFYYSSFLVFVVVIILLTHLFSLLNRKPKVSLNQNSFVVITGGCKGIGREMALQIARKHRCNIMIIDIRQDLFETLTQQITSYKAYCICVYCDLANDQSVQTCIQHIKQRQQKIDLLIYNAGAMIPQLSYKSCPQSRMKVMKVNYFSPIKMISSLMQQLEGGHLAVMASMVALISGGINTSMYGASKHAIHAWVSSFRQELKKHNRKITVSLGLPYIVRTQMFEGYKNRLSWLVRSHGKDYVGKRLVKEFLARKEVCFVDQCQALMFRIVQLFPSQLIDFAAIYLDQSDFTPVTKRMQKEAELGQSRQMKE